MNAELWVRPTPECMRIALKRFLDEVGVIYIDTMTNEELRQLYIKYECTKK